MLRRLYLCLYFTYPINPEVAITGNYLEFKCWHSGVGVKSYEFCVYKGGGPSGDIIHKETVPAIISSIQVAATALESGQVYPVRESHRRVIPLEDEVL